MNAEERLQELLDKKDEELRSVQERIEGYERAVEWKWSLSYDEEVDTFPRIPRLEIRRKVSDFDHVWEYVLVHRHLLGHVTFDVMGSTKCSGGGTRETDEEAIKGSGPFRDGVHICFDALHLRLPAYITSGDLWRKLDASAGLCAFSRSEAVADHARVA